MSRNRYYRDFWCWMIVVLSVSGCSCRQEDSPDHQQSKHREPDDADQSQTSERPRSDADERQASQSQPKEPPINQPAQSSTNDSSTTRGSSTPQPGSDTQEPNSKPQQAAKARRGTDEPASVTSSSSADAVAAKAIGRRHLEAAKKQLSNTQLTAAFASALEGWQVVNRFSNQDAECRALANELTQVMKSADSGATPTSIDQSDTITIK